MYFVNKQAFPITITILGEAQLLMMLHRPFANATQGSLENM